MPGELHNLEQALRGFLIESQNDSYNSSNLNVVKYNNLKLSMEPNDNKIPHVAIRLGISEAVYSLDNVEKLSGGLGSDERLVRRWLERTLIKADLQMAWQSARRVKPVVMRDEVDD